MALLQQSDIGLIGLRSFRLQHKFHKKAFRAHTSGKAGMSRQFSRKGDVVASIPSFATLINLKKLFRHSGHGQFIIEEHFLSQLIDSSIRSIFVDEHWYLTKYPDVKRSLDDGVVSSAKDHYVRFGYYEHRMPYQLLVDEAWYLAQYADVRAGVRREDFASGQDHFEIFGYREGRLPFANFALRRQDS